MAALSNEAPPSEQKSQSLICKVSTSLQLPLEGPVAIETVSVLRCVLGLRMRTGWSSLMVLMLFEKNKQYLWYSCCQILLVISNMKFNLNLGEQFWRIWCFPIQRDRNCTCIPERRFKDGRRVTGLALKGLWPLSDACLCDVTQTPPHNCLIDSSVSAQPGLVSYLRLEPCISARALGLF